MKKKILVTLAIFLGVVLFSVAAYGFYLYKAVTDTATVIHEPLEREQSSKRAEKVDVERQEPLSFLITGIDARGDNLSGRTDAVIVMTVNPNEESVKMLSIPRDTRTEIVGRGIQDKINHAHAFGGMTMTINTVEQFLDIPIDHYVSINMAGFKSLVDAMGGVTVNNDFAFNQSGHSFAAGEIFLNGDEALAYTRMRKNDPRGDFGRNDRQRQVVEAVIHDAAQLGSITRVGSILDAVGGSVRTDLSLDDMWTIQSKYRDARHTIQQMEITGDGTRINGVYYLQVPDDEVSRVSSELRDHLELDS
ncbi:LCP family protein [Halalkalibacter alkaliphilus]|uniref:Polyisoprenyl-teichoic acid--peptidoglycan teichoic acid transferase TagU n=1 Tax=Halalkalibacter alkaliphilus TaxID=2917993 RepID=A0A9X2CU84_9BACI|nr:LCP family protein [Halalkalibacter alkaliphilus]MCL7748034.1 LCP family protein [Halalkalibacter alkaliphilus]